MDKQIRIVPLVADDLALHLSALITTSERLLRAPALFGPALLDADIRAVNDTLLAIKDARAQLRTLDKVKRQRERMTIAR